MTQRSLAVLIVLNAVLLAAIGLTFGPAQKAEAQGLGGTSYLMIGGNPGSGSQQAVYILDKSTGRIVGFVFNSSTKKYAPIGVRNIVKDMEAAANN